MRRSPISLIAVLALVLVPLLAGCGSSDSSSGTKDKKSDSDLKSFTGAGFTIKLPEEPKKSTQTANSAAGPIKVTQYVIDNGDDAWIVGVNDLPGGKADLDGAVNGAASAVKGKVRSTKTLKYQGYEARDTRYTASSQGTQLTVFARIIEANGKLYQVQRLMKGENLSKPDKDYPDVLASLKIKK